MRSKLVVTGVVLAAAVLGLSYIYMPEFGRNRPLRASLDKGDVSGWEFFGGSWLPADGALRNVSGARGDKAVVRGSIWDDSIIEADLRFDSEAGGYGWGDAGIIFRATDASVGVDAYDGYYAGIGIEQSVLLIGRSNYSWAGLRSVPLPVTVRRGTWYKLRLIARGCYFDLTAREAGVAQEARLTYFDHDCTKKSGGAGLRTYGVRASWRNFVVKPFEGS